MALLKLNQNLISQWVDKMRSDEVTKWSRLGVGSVLGAGALGAAMIFYLRAWRRARQRLEWNQSFAEADEKGTIATLFETPQKAVDSSSSGVDASSPWAGVDTPSTATKHSSIDVQPPSPPRPSPLPPLLGNNMLPEQLAAKLQKINLPLGSCFGLLLLWTHAVVMGAKQSKLERKRSVVVVGVCGASCSGKSTLAKRLVDEFHSPFEAICADIWFKRVEDFPMCTHGYAGGCNEVPGAVDAEMYLQQVKRFIDELSRAPAGSPPSMFVEAPQDRGDWPSTGKELKLPGEGPVYVFLEGFKLFAEPEIVAICDHLVWLEADCETCGGRRANRDRMPQQYYEQHIWKAHMEWKQRMLDNANAHPSELITLDVVNRESISTLVDKVLETLRPNCQNKDVSADVKSNSGGEKA